MPLQLSEDIVWMKCNNERLKIRQLAIWCRLVIIRDGNLRQLVFAAILFANAFATIAGSAGRFAASVFTIHSTGNISVKNYQLHFRQPTPAEMTDNIQISSAEKEKEEKRYGKNLLHLEASNANLEILLDKLNDWILKGPEIWINNS